ncbi:MAG TPA: HigA family addiction module antitoxin [Oligoflexia bacterium]|nr:HigA family addiction module antitoxin [Oligoflexia bacterium]HMP49243.1 HigA family addiction module antitoxin [Oligoflexia bacterium]
MKTGNIKNVMNPGDVLKVIMDEHGLTQRQLAAHLKVSQPYLSDILRMKRGISPEMAYRLAKALGSTPQTWMNLQTNWLLSQVDQKKIKDVEKIAA